MNANIITICHCIDSYCNFHSPIQTKPSNGMNPSYNSKLSIHCLGVTDVEYTSMNSFIQNFAPLFNMIIHKHGRNENHHSNVTGVDTTHIIELYLLLNGPELMTFEDFSEDSSNEIYSKNKCSENTHIYITKNKRNRSEQNAIHTLISEANSCDDDNSTNIQPIPSETYDIEYIVTKGKHHKYHLKITLDICSMMYHEYLALKRNANDHQEAPIEVMNMENEKITTQYTCNSYIFMLNAGLWGYSSWNPTLHVLPDYAHDTTLIFVTSYTFEESEDDYDTVMEQLTRLNEDMKEKSELKSHYRETTYDICWCLESQINSIFNQYTLECKRKDDQCEDISMPSDAHLRSTQFEDFYSYSDVVHHIKLKSRTINGQIVDTYIPNYYIQCFYYIAIK